MATKASKPRCNLPMLKKPFVWDMVTVLDPRVSGRTLQMWLMVREVTIAKSADAPESATNPIRRVLISPMIPGDEKSGSTVRETISFAVVDSRYPPQVVELCLTPRQAELFRNTFALAEKALPVLTSKDGHVRYKCYVDNCKATSSDTDFLGAHFDYGVHPGMNFEKEKVQLFKVNGPQDPAILVTPSSFVALPAALNALEGRTASGRAVTAKTSTRDVSAFATGLKRSRETEEVSHNKALKAARRTMADAGPGASQRAGVSTIESRMPDQAALGDNNYWSFSQEREQLIDDYMKKHPVAEEVQAEEEELLCICLQPEDDRAMIQCSNGDACRLEWYHFDCLGLTAEDIPEGDEAWFCPECVKEGDNIDDGAGAAVINMTPRTELKPRSAKAKASKAIARDLEDLGGVIDDGDSDEDSPAPSPSIRLKPWSADMIQSFVQNSDNIRDYDLTTLATAKAALRARAAEPIGQPKKLRGGSNIDTTYSSMYKSPNCRSWTAEEEQHLTEVVKECSDAGLAGEALWAAAHPKLVARGVNRPMGGMKMRWCRGLRDQTKIDERRKKNKKLLTAVQKPKVDREPGAPKKGRFKGKAFHAMRREAPVKAIDPSQQPDVAAPKSAPLSALSALPAVSPLTVTFPVEKPGQPGRRKRAMSV